MAKLLIKTYNNKHNFYGYVAKEQTEEDYVLYTEDPEQAKQYDSYKEAVNEAESLLEGSKMDYVITNYDTDGYVYTVGSVGQDTMRGDHTVYEVFTDKDLAIRYRDALNKSRSYNVILDKNGEYIDSPDPDDYNICYWTIKKYRVNKVNTVEEAEKESKNGNTWRK